MISCILIGFLLDMIFGDPKWLYHPVQLIGKFITIFEKNLRKIFKKTGKSQVVGGVILAIIVVTLSLGIPWGILIGAERIHPWLSKAIEILFCYQIFAMKSLRTQSLYVYQEIKDGNITEARRKLSWIVGRDTKNLSFKEIIKAVVETIAENTSDGVIAPMMFLFIGGAPLGFFYKAINTLDSMVGYKNERYLYFGRFSAKLDDVVNYIPARITGLLFVISSFLIGLDGKHSYKILKRDRKNHASPNSGNPEAACAGALNIQLAGDSYYFGKLYKKKTIGDDNRPVELEDIKRTNRLMYCSGILSLILFSCLRWALVVTI